MLHFFFLCVFLWQIVPQNVTRLCKTKSILSVNGKFPGPGVVAREGDRLIIKVVNKVANNISIHWYGNDHISKSFKKQCAHDLH